MRVVVADPWSFVDEKGSNTFTADVIAADSDVMLVRLAGQYYVATPRGDTAYSMVPVTDAAPESAPPWGRDDWRGHPPALLADIREV